MLVFRNRLLSLGVGFVILLLSLRMGDAASTIGTALQTVVAAISLFHVSDLDFAEGVQGESEKTILPGTMETPENASFEVVGEPNHHFVIILPGDQDVRMKLTTGSNNPLTQEIPVFGFKSFPASLAQLEPNGKRMLYVGATRAALPVYQVPGKYEGTFLVHVIYTH